jgi:hypothetical protein
MDDIESLSQSWSETNKRRSTESDLLIAPHEEHDFAFTRVQNSSRSDSGYDSSGYTRPVNADDCTSSAAISISSTPVIGGGSVDFEFSNSPPQWERPPGMHVFTSKHTPLLLAKTLELADNQYVTLSRIFNYSLDYCKLHANGLPLDFKSLVCTTSDILARFV